MTALAPTSPRPDRRQVPPLVSGDRLTRDEFERRYRASPGIRAELIEGTVIVASPVSETWHGMPHVLLSTWIGVYFASTPGVLVGDNSTVRLDLDNEPQPDLYVRIHPDAGGQTTTSDESYTVGAPELVAEVAASSASIDLHAKLDAYRRNGVREYIVWRTYDEALDWRVLRGSSFEPLATSDGVYKSEVFPGLWLDAAALQRRDMAQVLAVLQQGLASPEHHAFVERLKAALAGR